MGELMGDLDGMVALVTGGASGIGAATAALLADRGARTAVLDLDPEAGDPRHLRLAATSPTRRRWSGPSSGSRATSAAWTWWSTTPGSAPRATSPPTTTTSGIGS